MERVSLWAPPNVGCESLCDNVNEWMRLNPSKYPYERFIQDFVSSRWPMMWHLKTEHAVWINVEERVALHDADAPGVISSPVCAICHNVLGGAVERLACNHVFHTMCIHTWLRRADTCPMCRAVVCT